MKAVIKDIQNQGNTQINIVVDFFDDEDNLIKSRVIPLPEEKYEQMDETQLLEHIKKEGERFSTNKEKMDQFAHLVGTTVELNK